MLWLTIFHILHIFILQQGDVTVSSKEPDHPRASSLPEPSILSSGDATAATVTLGASTGGTLFDRVLESIPVPAIVEDVRRELCAPNPVEVRTYASVQFALRPIDMPLYPLNTYK